MGLPCAAKHLFAVFRWSGELGADRLSFTADDVALIYRGLDSPAIGAKVEVAAK
jgi:hypothetical protein